MKMLAHRVTGNPVLPFDIDPVKAHLRISGDEEDAAIENMALTAALEIEHFAQIALITQTIRVTIFQPDMRSGIELPIGPVADDHTPTITIDGEAFTSFNFYAGNRPYIAWQGGVSQLTPGHLVIQYEAGFGPAASDIPADLAQAIMDQAALHYDARSPVNTRELTRSPHMARIGARYRGVKV